MVPLIARYTISAVLVQYHIIFTVRSTMFPKLYLAEIRDDKLALRRGAACALQPAQHRPVHLHVGLVKRSIEKIWCSKFCVKIF